jgi:hypothetical protein
VTGTSYSGSLLAESLRDGTSCAPQESRTISSTGSSGVFSGTGSPAMLRSSNSTAWRPVSASGTRTVVSGGVRNSATGDPPPEQPSDRPDGRVPQPEQVVGGQPPGFPVVGAHQWDAAAGYRLQADRRHVPPEQVGDHGVLLDLGRGGDDAVHPPLDQRPHDVGPVRAAGRQVPDQDGVPRRRIRSSRWI